MADCDASAVCVGAGRVVGEVQSRGPVFLSAKV